MNAAVSGAWLLIIHSELCSNILGLVKGSSLTCLKNLKQILRSLKSNSINDYLAIRIGLFPYSFADEFHIDGSYTIGIDYYGSGMYLDTIVLNYHDFIEINTNGEPGLRAVFKVLLKKAGTYNLHFRFNYGQGKYEDFKLGKIILEYFNLKIA